MNDAAMRPFVSSLWSLVRHPTRELRAAIKRQLAAVEWHLDNLRTRVVEELRKELRRAILILSLSAAAALLGFVGGLFALLGTWLSLSRALGAAGASFMLAALFLFLSLGAVRALHSVTTRGVSQPPPSARNTAT
jgi:hypothetical protein